MLHHHLLPQVLFIAFLLVGSIYTSEVKPHCRCIPSDKCWPSLREWAKLNATVHGRLVATKSIAAPCHDPDFDAAQCSLLQTKWGVPSTHYNSSSSPMAGVTQNQSCDPFTARQKPCVLGNVVDYAINVTGATDVAAGLRFAKLNNIRLVIRNTGHDYWGKSSGKGSLAIWTHHLKTTQFMNYTSPGYTGHAAKLGAGVQGFDAVVAANAHGLRVLVGDCITVGVAGGYIQGGGHSALSSLHGLAADQTLEWEVVTASGRLVRAAPDENPDLYWALSGGGGGTYGVVLSVTVKAFPDGVTGGATLSATSRGVSQETWWSVVEVWHTLVPAIVDGGAAFDWQISAETFIILPFLSPGSSESQVLDLFKGLTNLLDQSNVTYTLQAASFSTYLEHVLHWMGPLPDSVFPIQQINGGRLIPRSVIETNNAAYTAVIRNITLDPNFGLAHVALNVAHSVAGNIPGSNAVHPAWRDTIFSVIVIGTWNFTATLDTNLAVVRKLTEVVTPMMDAISPGSGSYLNEGDNNQVGWKEAYYGVNYEKLLAIKQKWDPEHQLYAKTAVGSDAWLPDRDGRLCRA